MVAIYTPLPKNETAEEAKSNSHKCELHKCVMIIAGEKSGDILGAELVAEMLKQNPNLSFVGVAGDAMQAAGVENIFPQEELSIMGVMEVLPHICHLAKRIDEMVEVVEEFKVDILVTIDSPDFTLRVAKKIKKKYGIPCVHYVSPSVWAWRKGRANKMAKYLDHVLALLPFEPEFYKTVGLDCTYVGHPVAGRLQKYSPEVCKQKESEYVKSTKVSVAILPGSREGVMRRMFPEMFSAYKKLKADNPDLKAVIPLSHDYHRDLLLEIVPELAEKPFCDDVKMLNDDDKFAGLKNCKLALATSGTSNLELAMLGVPMVVAYKMGMITNLIVKYLVDVPYASPVSWVAGKKVVPELLQEDANADKLYELGKLLIDENREERRQQLADLKFTREKLVGDNNSSPSERAAKVVLSYL